MKKDWKALETVRPYRLAHQTLCITGFNFETESLVGFVEMLIHPINPDFRKVCINSKQCRIYRVAINDNWEASFSYSDPTLEVCLVDSKQRNLDHFERSHTKAMASVDADTGNGELVIKLPTEVVPIVQEMKSFKICIEFSLERPRGGIKFVVPDTDGTMLDRGAHLFTYGSENSSRLWFPCIDSFAEVCTWKLEFTVNMYMTAVSVGDLIETVYTADLRKKTYHYYMAVPTAAPNIALAVGPFEVFVDPHMHEVTHFCLPHLMPVLKQTTSFLHEVFEFYEELLSTRYPYTCYKQVFVDMAYKDISPYATMTICSTNLLHCKQIIDQTPITRQLLAQSIAHQFFGCFISMNSWCDAWLPKGLSAYLCSMYKRKAFGMSEYRYFVAQEMAEVSNYEHTVGPVVLDPSNVQDNGHFFTTRHPHAISPAYSSIYDRKAHLIIRMMEIHLGRELMLQVLNKLLALAISASQQKFTSNTWSNILVSTNSFLKCISTVTGKDIHTFMEQWVYRGGITRIVGSFVFNVKRNMVELELKQDSQWKGAQKYAGPLSVSIQELDGTFHHKILIEENKTKFEFTCHSKSRRQKKKKIPLSTLEEVDMDLSDSDSASPVLWIRIDPEMTILRSIEFEQPDWMWQYMLRYERCVVSQYEAILALDCYASPKSRQALTATIENEKCFYRIRIDAAQHLAKIANAMVGSWAGPPAMMNLFQKMFGSHSCAAIIRQNNFTNFQHYFLQKAIPLAMANLRNVHNICPPEVHKFLLDLFKYNDNSKNKFSDNYYRAALIEALSATVTPAVTTVTIKWNNEISTDALTPDTKDILDELTRFLNMEKLLPSYRFTVTVSCLKAIRRLQRFGHLPNDDAVFKSYAIEGNFSDVRLAALEALVDFTAAEASSNTDASSHVLSWLLDIVERDSDPYIRYRVLHMLCINPPFTVKDAATNPLCNEELIDRLWTFMNSTFAHDSRLRCVVADLYYTLLGRGRPSCLPIPESVVVLNLKERRTIVNPSLRADISQDSYDGARNSPAVGVKRPASSPVHFADMDRSLGPDLGLRSEPSDDSFKIKISYGGDSGVSHLSGWSAHNLAPIESHSEYLDDFQRFQSSASTIPSSASVSLPRVAYEVTVNNDDTEMRLSEDSSDASYGSPVRYHDRSQSRERNAPSPDYRIDSPEYSGDVSAYQSVFSETVFVDDDYASPTHLPGPSVLPTHRVETQVIGRQHDHLHLSPQSVASSRHILSSSSSSSQDFDVV